MKTELLKIAQDLEQGTITENEARTLLLGLLGVSNCLSVIENSQKVMQETFRDVNDTNAVNIYQIKLMTTREIRHSIERL